ncbi:MAG: hypothetical protein Q8882_07870 [Bacillota bacterium]|nr:hypothetical protein [Bacillota bacterium]
MKVRKFTTGLLTGAVIGIAAGAIIDPVPARQRRMIQRKSSHLFKLMGSALDGITDLF